MAEDGDDHSPIFDRGDNLECAHAVGPFFHTTPPQNQSLIAWVNNRSFTAIGWTQPPFSVSRLAT
jgi:hypothetical protein